MSAIRNNRKMPDRLNTGIKLFIALLALSENSLVVLEWGYEVDIPVIKWFFAVFKSINAWGISTIFMAVGLGAVFYAVQKYKRERTPWLSALCAFFAVSTVFGKSYLETESWDYVFHGRIQFGLAVFVMTGYYFVYKNCILFAAYVLDHRKQWFRRETVGKAEYYMFEKHSFLIPFLAVLVLGLPYLIVFFPGTLQWDAHRQLWEVMGVIPLSGHHPVFVTKLMGLCLDMGRRWFHSDSMGLFLYTAPQFLLQCTVMAYSINVLCRMKAPLVFRWGAMAFYALCPIFPIWGYTMVKDTGYYIFTLLFIAVLMDILHTQSAKILLWRTFVLAVSTVGIGVFRNNGRYVVVISLILAAVICKKYWKVYLTGLLACLLAIFMVEGIYMPYKGIPDGPVGEMLSVPLQQTARYVKEHYDEITEEEMEVLAAGFGVDIAQLGELYKPEISDPVKEKFVSHPEKEYLLSYFEVWWNQFLKHPDTYVQAFLNHVYGYFYPDRENFWGSIGIYYIGNAQHWQDGYMDIAFGIQNKEVRDLFEQTKNLISRMPVVGMMYSCGLYTYGLLGCAVYLIVKKRKRGFVVLIPSFCVLLVCMVSPVDAYFRYMLPIAAVFPLTLAWCYSFVHPGETKDERQTAGSVTNNEKAETADL